MLVFIDYWLLVLHGLELEVVLGTTNTEKKYNDEENGYYGGSGVDIITERHFY